MALIEDRALMWRIGRQNLRLLALGTAAGGAAGLVDHAVGAGLRVGMLLGALSSSPYGWPAGTLVAVGGLLGAALDHFAVGALVGATMEVVRHLRRRR